MSGEEELDVLLAMRAANDRRAALVRRNWLLLAAALACGLGFAGIVLTALALNWFPWWLLTVAFVLEVGAFACLRFVGGAR